MKWTSVVMGVALSVAFACSEEQPTKPAQPAPAAVAAPAESPTPVVTVLVTGEESGALTPTPGKDGPTGGSAELLGKWITEEHHCAGAVGTGGAAACPQDMTIVASIGNHFNGPAISSYFHGESTAEVMKRMGYAVSGFGNHELDFGKEQFLKDASIGGFPYVSANLKVKSADAKDLQLQPFVIVERQGMKVALIGLSRLSAPTTSMSGRFDGLEIAPIEDALSAAVPKAWSAGADAVVVLSDDCGTELDQAISKHPDWKISVAAIDHCHAPTDRKAGTVPVVSPGIRFSHYLRAKLSFDRSKPAGQRLTSVETAVLDSGSASPDTDTVTVISQWKRKVDAQLGEQIGFTKKGLAEGSTELGNWVATAWKDSLKTDVAIVNKKGMRQGIPAGKITQASVYSVMPFENSLMIAKVSGADLVKDLANDQAVYAGVKIAGKGFKDEHGKAIDPKKTYSVATVEYLYFGGDNFEFEKQDAQPNETGMMAQTPIIDWTKKAASTEAKPLETLIK